APLVFTVRLRMVLNIPEIVKCGKMLGIDIPSEGPLEGVPIHWETLIGDYDWLDRHGTIAKQDVTDKDGKATLTYTPESEKIPGFGSEHTKAGALQPSADVFGKFGNGLGQIWDVAGANFVTLGF